MLKWTSRFGSYNGLVDSNDSVNLDRGSYLSDHVLLNLLNELGKRDKTRGLINSIIQGHEC